MKIPKTQKDILVKTFLQYKDFLEGLTESEREDEKLLLFHTIRIFYGVDKEGFESMPYTSILDMFNIINNILNKKQELVPTFLLEGVEYGLLPDFSDMTFGELVDCNTTDVLQQMSILYRPIVKKKNSKYFIEKYSADISTMELFKENLTLDIYLGFISFFLNTQNDLLNFTLKYLMDQDIVPEMKSNLVRSGVGTRSLLNSAMAT